MRESNALWAVHARQDHAFLQLAPGSDQDVTAGLASLARAETCTMCVGNLLRHPWVKRLRVMAQAGEPQLKRAADPARKTTPQIEVERVRRRRGVA